MTIAPGVGIPDPQIEPTMRVWPETGQLLGLSKASTYEGIARGEIPSIRIGRRLLVPTAALRRMVGLDQSTDESLQVPGDDRSGAA